MKKNKYGTVKSAEKNETACKLCVYSDSLNLTICDYCNKNNKNKEYYIKTN